MQVCFGGQVLKETAKLQSQNREREEPFACKLLMSQSRVRL